MKTNNLKKSLANIAMIKAQFDELYELDFMVGKFMHSLLCDMSKQKITPDDFFTGFCYATFEYYNKHGDIRCEDTGIIPDEPCPTCPLRTHVHTQDWQTRVCLTCPLHDLDNMPSDGGDEIDGA